MLGESTVGKTCLVKRYVENYYNPEEKSSIGCTFLSKSIKI